jgi:hypothetical protein
MGVAGTRPWQFSEDRWPETYEVPLWFRAAERIDVPAAGVVPGPADIDALPARSPAPAGPSELVAGMACVVAGTGRPAPDAGAA